MSDFLFGLVAGWICAALTIGATARWLRLRLERALGNYAADEEQV